MTFINIDSKVIKFGETVNFLHSGLIKLKSKFILHQLKRKKYISKTSLETEGYVIIIIGDNKETRKKRKITTKVKSSGKDEWFIASKVINRQVINTRNYRFSHNSSFKLSKIT